MVLQERNQMIYQIHLDHPDWSLEKIADLVGISRQRVHRIVTHYRNSAIIPLMEDKNKVINIGDKPISATQAAEITGISYGTISKWVERNLVKIVSRPNRRACTGQPVLLDPITLQKRIDNYRPRRKMALTTD